MTTKDVGILEQHIKETREQLLNESLRSPLINYRPRKASGVEFTKSDPAGIFQALVDAEKTLLIHPVQKSPRTTRRGESDSATPSLRTRETPDALEKRLVKTYRDARTALEETGVNLLFLTMGMLTWHEADHSDKPRLAPLVLIPVTLERRHNTRQFHLKHDGEDISVNLTLIQHAKRNHGLELPGELPRQEPLDADGQGDTDDQGNIDVAGYLRKVDSVIRGSGLRGWTVDHRRMTLGFFSSNKLLMVIDLDPDVWVEAGAPLENSEIIRALFRDGFREPPSDISDSAQLDARLPPDETFHVLDADSYQTHAIHDAISERNMVIHGPPGTGKSQTIVNILAAAVANGKRVLFVAEKRAALEVVKRRMDGAGLGHLCLELHSGKANKRQFVEDLKDTKSALGTSPSPESVPSDDIQRLRGALNDYARDVNEPVGASGLTPQKAMGWLLQHWDAQPNPLRWQELRGIQQWSTNGYTEKRRMVDDFRIRLGDLGRRPSEHSWHGVRITAWSPSLGESLAVDLREALEAVDAAEAAGRTLAEDLRQRLADLLGGAEQAATGLDDATQALILALQDHLEGVLNDAGQAATGLKDVGQALAQSLQRHLEGVLDAALQAANACQGTAATLAERLRQDAPANPAGVVALLDIADTVHSAPPLHGLNLAAPEWRDAPRRIREKLRSGLRMNELREEYATVFLPSAWAADLLETRQLLNAFGRSLFSRLTFTYRRANRELAVHLRGAPPKTLDGKLALIDAVMEYQDLQQQMTPADGSGLGWLANSMDPDWNALEPGILWWAGYASHALDGLAEALQDMTAPGGARSLEAATTETRSAHQAFRHADERARGAWEWTATLPAPTTPWEEYAQIVDEQRRQVADLPSLPLFRAPAGLYAFTARMAGASGSEQVEQALRAAQPAWERWQRDQRRAERAWIWANPAPTGEAASFDAFAHWLGAGRGELQTLPRIQRHQTPAGLDTLITTLTSNSEAAHVEPAIATVQAALTGWHERHGKVTRAWDWEGSLPGDAQASAADRAAWLSACWQELPALRGLAEPQSPAGQDALLARLEGSEVAPLVAEDAARAQAALDNLRTRIQRINATADWTDSAAAKYAALGHNSTWTESRRLLESLIERLPTLNALVQVQEAARHLRRQGMGAVVDLAENQPDAPESLTRWFERAWHECIVDPAGMGSTALSSFSADLHENHIREFRRLDKAWIRANPARVMHRYSTNSVMDAFRNPARPGQQKIPYSKQDQFLAHQFQLQRGHRSIRKCLEEAPDFIQNLKPVFMMSPLSVAKFLPPGDLSFDLVVFDEASQVRPADALGALLRGQKAVVVGDEKQLPPTTFFERMLNDDDDDDDAADDPNSARNIESILGLFVSRGALERKLNFHYRSRHESLIAVSNHDFYKGELVVLPSADAERAEAGLHFRHLPGTTYDRGGTRTNPKEAEAVAQAVMEHARRNPTLSLGVVAFNQKQAEAIFNQVEAKGKGNTDWETFSQSHANEPFFVKSLENVQGDERDVIFISVGYGKGEDGRVTQNFGPLNKEGGGRRLNVLITRAKCQCHVFTSLRADNIAKGDTTGGPLSSGPTALKNFLYYAEHGKMRIPAVVTGREVESPFQQAVADALADRGHEVSPEVGVGGYFIDIAVVHPEQRGRYVIGIECDGASYHSSKTARERDRIRQAHLERLGWTLHRVWSTDWWHDPQRALQKCEDAIRRAIAASG